MKIINPLIIIFFLGLWILLISSPAFAFRCNGRIVSLGDTKSQVVNKCGDPSHIESWEEERFTEDEYYYQYRHYRSREKFHRHYAAKENVKIEEWTYNFGPTTFVRYLLFKKGRLKEIRLGDKGYYQ